MEIQPENLPACAKEMPRLAGSNSWCLAKVVETFSPGETCALDLEPAIPMIAGKLCSPEGRVLFRWLPQFGSRAVPLVLTGLASTDLDDRRLAVSAMTQMSDPRLVAPLAGLFRDPDPSIRASACQAAAWKNWDSAFAPQIVQLLSDKDPKVRWAACNCLEFHRPESKTNIAVYQKMVEEGGVAMAPAMWLLWLEHVPIPKESVLPLLSSTDPGTYRKALQYLRERKLELNDISPLLTNSSPVVRRHGVALLMSLHDRAATARIVSMLRDPDEGLRWMARNSLRWLSGKKLGPDPAVWEKWWADNKDTFTPTPRVRPPPAHPAMDMR
jgi:HEAT repeat protein